VFRRAQDWLRHRGADDQAEILNALPIHVAVLDAQGTIISVNQTWQRFQSAGPTYGPGRKSATITSRFATKNLNPS